MSVVDINKNEDFESVVSRHLRTVTDKDPQGNHTKISQSDIDILMADPRAWWGSLVGQKKAVETQLAARKAELALVKSKAQIRLWEGYEEDIVSAQRSEADYQKWRASALRFKNVVDQALGDVKRVLIQEDINFLKDALVMERDMLANELKEIKKRLSDFSYHTCDERCVVSCWCEDDLMALLAS